MYFYVPQVIGHEKRPTTKQVVKSLIADEGWLGLYRGLGPRFFSMSAWGTSMILAYEYLSKSSSFCHFGLVFCLFTGSMGSSLPCFVLFCHSGKQICSNNCNAHSHSISEIAELPRVSRSIYMENVESL